MANPLPRTQIEIDGITASSVVGSRKVETLDRTLRYIERIQNSRVYLWHQNSYAHVASGLKQAMVLRSTALKISVDAVAIRLKVDRSETLQVDDGRPLKKRRPLRNKRKCRFPRMFVALSAVLQQT